MTAAEHAATVRLAILGADDSQEWALHEEEAIESLAALVALAERATELERKLSRIEEATRYCDCPHCWRVMERAEAAEARATELERANSEGRVEEAELRAEYLAITKRATELERERDHWKQEAEGLVSEQRVAEAAVERAVRAEKALRQADDLLRRLDEWDVMNSTHDGPYWKREIAAARAALGEAAP